MLAAEERAVLLEPVTDDADAAVLAGRRQRMDCAFEAVKRVGGAIHAHLERLVVIVSARFASGHGNLPSAGVGTAGITRSRRCLFLRAHPIPRHELAGPDRKTLAQDLG